MWHLFNCYSIWVYSCEFHLLIHTNTFMYLYKTTMWLLQSDQYMVTCFHTIYPCLLARCNIAQQPATPATCTLLMRLRAGDDITTTSWPLTSPGPEVCVSVDFVPQLSVFSCLALFVLLSDSTKSLCPSLQLFSRIYFGCLEWKSFACFLSRFLTQTCVETQS